MKNRIEELNKWLYHRIRMCIWKQWKKPRTKDEETAEKLGVPEALAWQAETAGKRILVYIKHNGNGKYGNDKRKTDKQWLL